MPTLILNFQTIWANFMLQGYFRSSIYLNEFNISEAFKLLMFKNKN